MSGGSGGARVGVSFCQNFATKAHSRGRRLTGGDAAEPFTCCAVTNLQVNRISVCEESIPAKVTVTASACRNNAIDRRANRPAGRMRGAAAVFFSLYQPDVLWPEDATAENAHPATTAPQHFPADGLVMLWTPLLQETVNTLWLPTSHSTLTARPK